MVFLCRLRQSQLKTLSNQIKKCNAQAYYTSNASAHTALCGKAGSVMNPNFSIQKTQFQFPNNVRFFAAPVQAKPKKEDKDTGGPRLNEKITASVVRLVSDEGHCVVSRHEALERARRLNVDLVEVQRNAQPPVCKLMDYNKEKYKQQVKDKERSKSKSDTKKGIVKEVRFSGQITQNDLQLKADTVKRLLEEGYRVKCMVTRKKKEDLGELLSRFLVLIEDVSMVEHEPRVEEQQAHLIVRHVKLGPSKKPGKKVSKEAESATDSHQKAAAADDDDSDKKETTWEVCDSEDVDFDRVFDVKDGVDGVIKSSMEQQTTTMNSRAGINPAGANTASTTKDSPPVAENRYKRDPRSSSPPARSTDGYGPAPSNTRFTPPSMDHRRQPQFHAPLQNQQAVQHGAQPSRYSNTNSPANQNSPGSSSQSSTGSSFGIFSAPRTETTPGKQNAPAEVNRYKKTSHPGPARNSSPTGFSPMSNHRSRGQGVDRDREGKFGIFSQTSTNSPPGQNTENQVKVDR